MISPSGSIRARIGRTIPSSVGSSDPATMTAALPPLGLIVREMTPSATTLAGLQRSQAPESGAKADAPPSSQGCFGLLAKRPSPAGQ